MTMPSQPINPINPINDPLDQAIDQLLANYQTEMTEIGQLQADGDSEEQLQKQLAQWEAELQLLKRWSPGASHTIAYVERQIAGIKAQIANLQPAITVLEEQIESLDPAFTSMANTINSLLATFQQAAMSGKASSAADWSHFADYLTQVFTAAKQQAQADYEAALMQEEESDPSNSSQNSSETTAQYLNAELAEAATMRSLQGTLTTDLGTYNEALNNAKAEESGIHWYDFGWYDSEESNAEATEQNATAMQNTIASLLATIAPLTASTSSDMTQLNQQIKELLKEVRKILEDTSLTDAAKLTQVLSLMMGALTLIGESQADFTSDKESLRQKMADATIQTSQVEIVNSAALQRTLANELHYASVMSSLMKVVQIVVGTIMSLLAPGIGSGLAMAAATILDATGVVDKLTSKLASAIGQIGADVIVALSEAIVTFGGGAILDRVLADIVKTAIKLAIDATARIVEEIVEAATAQSVELTANILQRNLAKTVIQNAVDTAVAEAGRKTLLQFMKQGIISLLSAFGKSIGANGTNALEKLAENTILTAAKDAAERAVPFAEKVLLGGLLSDAEMEEIEEIGESAADQAVADATLTTEKKVAESTTDQSLGRIFLGKTAAGFVYTAGQTNLLMDLANRAQKALGGSTDDDWYQYVQGIVEILQMVIGVLAQIYAGQAVSLQGSSLATAVMRLTTAVEAASMGMQTTASAGQADAYGLQAEAVRAVAENQADLDVLNMTQKEITTWSGSENDRDMQQLASDLQTSTQISLHLWDSRDALAQVLAAQAM